jgi:hypothetical protein
MVQWQVHLVLLSHADAVFNGVLSSMSRTVFLVRAFKLWKMQPSAIIALEKFGPVDLWHRNVVLRFWCHFERAQDTHLLVLREPLFLLKSPQALFQVMALQLKNWVPRCARGRALVRHASITRRSLVA